MNADETTPRRDSHRLGPAGRHAPRPWDPPSRWRRGAAVGHWVPLVDRRDLRVVLNRFLLYPEGLIFAVDLASKPTVEGRSEGAQPSRSDDTMTLLARYPDGQEASTFLIVPGSRPACAIGPSYLGDCGGSDAAEPAAPRLRVLGAEAVGQTASYSLWLWPQPPGLFEVSLEWNAGGLRLDVLVDLPWVDSMWGPAVRT